VSAGWPTSTDPDSTGTGRCEALPMSRSAAGAPACMNLAGRSALVRLANRFCWNREDAEDAVQNALLIAARKVDRVADPDRVDAWLRSIVIRQAIDLARRRRRETRAIPPDATACAPAPPDAALADELNDVLRRLIMRLPRRQQIALVLRHLEGMEYEAIASLMEAAESTVRVLVRNARETLRRWMIAEHPEWATAPRGE
jgi:RNA polymerase sigma-70 factor (ECF subfamily)